MIRLAGLAAILAVMAAVLLPAAAGASTTTRTFVATGAEQTYTVPPGVTSITVTAIGGKGGNGSIDDGGETPGGFGAVATGTFTVTPGDTIYVEVGGNGTMPNGGFNGGGDGGTPSGGGFGGGGGGASDIRLCSRSAGTCTAGDGTTLGSRLLVAAGGGGGGATDPCCTSGGSGGAAGQAGGDTGGPSGTAGGGGAGTSMAGGAGGGGDYGAAGPGTLGNGGDAADGGYRDGGGGGGGLYGGGAGGNIRGFYSAGAGGGSSLVPMSGTVTADASGVPSVAISYVPGPAAAVALDVRPASIQADGTSTTTATATVTDAAGSAVGGENVKITTDAGNTVSAVTDHGDGTYTATITSTTSARTVTATATDITSPTDPSGTDTFAQTHGPVTNVSVVASPSSIPSDGTSTTTATATATDAHGNRVSGETMQITTDSGNVKKGSTTDNGDGTYSATFYSTTDARTVTVTAVDSGAPGTPSNTTTFQQTPLAPSNLDVQMTPTAIVADGSSTALATATVTDAHGNGVAGQSISFQTDAGNAVGAVSYQGDGTYTAQITSTTTARTVTVKAIDSTATPVLQGTSTLYQTPGQATAVSVVASPASIVADGNSTTTATATVTDAHGNRVPGKTVAFSTNAGNTQAGLLNDNGDGTYSATFHSTTVARSVTVTATVTNVTGTPSGTGSFTQTSGATNTVHLGLTPSSIRADAASTSTATATVTDANGNPVRGHAIAFQTNAGNPIGSVTDNGDGTYSAAITSTTSARSVTVKATDDSAAGHPSDTAALTQTPGTATSVSVALAPSTVSADGTSSSTATATVTDANGNRVPGDAVTIGTNAGNAVSAVVDNGDGTYSSTVTSTTAVRSVTVTATDTSPAGHPSATATLAQTPGTANGLSAAVTPATVPADDSSTATVTATLTDAHGHGLAGQGVTFSSTDSHQRIGPVTDHGDGTYSATVTASRTAGAATITATAGSKSGTAALTQTDVTSPAVSIGAPADGSMFVKDQLVKAAYDCQDDAGGTGIASCTGTTAVGADIDTSSPGEHTFSVTATDNAGNATTRTATYTVIAIPSIEIGSPALSLEGGTVKVNKGKGKVRATCSGPAGLKCAGKLSASALVAQRVGKRLVVKRLTVASGKFSLSTQSARSFTITLNRAGLRLLKGGAITATLTAAGVHGTPRSFTSLITLR